MSKHFILGKTSQGVPIPASLFGSHGKTHSHLAGVHGD